MKQKELLKAVKNSDTTLSKESKNDKIAFSFSVSRSAESNLMAMRIGIAMAMFGPEKGINNLEASGSDSVMMSASVKAVSEEKKSRYSK